MEILEKQNPKNGVASGREQEILAAAATLFAHKGYSATTVRDIGQQVGLLGGSLYHYIRSKEALFVKLHELALQRAEDRIRAAIEDVTDPWKRIEVACRTLLDIQLDPNSLTMPLMNDFRAVPQAVRDQLIVKRDAFEQMFKQLVSDLPLPKEVDKGVYRLLLLTIMNNSSIWYRASGMSIDELNDQIMQLFRR